MTDDGMAERGRKLATEIVTSRNELEEKFSLLGQSLVDYYESVRERARQGKNPTAGDFSDIYDGLRASVLHINLLETMLSELSKRINSEYHFALKAKEIIDKNLEKTGNTLRMLEESSLDL